MEAQTAEAGDAAPGEEPNEEDASDDESEHGEEWSDDEDPACIRGIETVFTLDDDFIDATGRPRSG